MRTTTLDRVLHRTGFLSPLLVALLLPGCSQKGELQVARQEVAYGPHPMQRLDLYLPEKCQGKLPLVMWVHGGGWEGGDKAESLGGDAYLAKEFLRRGYAFASCNYRLIPEYPFPAQLDDVQRAVRWLRAHAAEFHIDPDRMGAAGNSAGGQLAALLGVRETRAAQADDLDQFSSRVSTVVALCGPHDLRDYAPLQHPNTLTVWPKLFGPGHLTAFTEKWDASPYAFVNDKSAPMLLITGDHDINVWPAHSVRMAAALKEAGVASQLILLAGRNHAIYPAEPVVRRPMLEWFDSYLKGNSPPSPREEGNAVVSAAESQGELQAEEDHSSDARGLSSSTRSAAPEANKQAVPQ